MRNLSCPESPDFLVKKPVFAEFHPSSKVKDNCYLVFLNNSNLCLTLVSVTVFYFSVGRFFKHDFFYTRFKKILFVYYFSATRHRERIAVMSNLTMTWDVLTRNCVSIKASPTATGKAVSGPTNR